MSDGAATTQQDAPQAELNEPGRPRYGRVLAGTVHSPVINSRVLSASRFKEPTARELLVYTPPGAGDTRLPVVLMLPAFFGSHRSAFRYDPFKANTFELVDGLIQKGECDPFILVVPDVMTRWGGGQFVDSDTSGNWQTFLADEVIPFVDREFSTIESASGRAVVGRSSGGFGALRLAMDRPGIVSAVASHAGDALFDVSMRPMLTHAAVAFRDGAEAFARRIDEGGPKSAVDFDGLFVLACSAAYAPLAGVFPYCELPVSRDGSIIESAWQKWLAHDPVVRVKQASSALRELSLVFVDAGESDEHGLQFAAEALRFELEKVGAAVEHESHVGGHRGTSWRYGVSLPKIVAQLSGQSN